MNGVWLGSKAIRVNWANQKPQSQGSSGQRNRADIEQIMSLVRCRSFSPWFVD